MDRTREEEEKLAEWLKIIMLKKLEQNRHKKHWKDESVFDLLVMLDEEVLELWQEMGTKNYHEAILECADIANIAAFISEKLKEVIENADKAS